MLWLSSTVDRTRFTEQVIKPESLQILLQRSQNGLVCVLQAACVLLAGVNVITVAVNDVPMARADKLCRGRLMQLGNRHTKGLAEPRRLYSLVLLLLP